MQNCREMSPVARRGDDKTDSHKHTGIRVPSQAKDADAFMSINNTR